MLNKQYYVEKAKVEKLIARKNQKTDFYNGIYDRYEYPVLTREFAPVEWRYDKPQFSGTSRNQCSDEFRCY